MAYFFLTFNLGQSVFVTGLLKQSLLGLGAEFQCNWWDLVVFSRFTGRHLELLVVRTSGRTFCKSRAVVALSPALGSRVSVLPVNFYFCVAFFTLDFHGHRGCRCVMCVVLLLYAGIVLSFG